MWLAEGGNCRFYRIDLPVRMAPPICCQVGPSPATTPSVNMLVSQTGHPGKTAIKPAKNTRLKRAKALAATPKMKPPCKRLVARQARPAHNSGFGSQIRSQKLHSSSAPKDLMIRSKMPANTSQPDDGASPTWPTGRKNDVAYRK